MFPFREQLKIFEYLMTISIDLFEIKNCLRAAGAPVQFFFLASEINDFMQIFPVIEFVVKSDYAC